MCIRLVTTVLLAVVVAVAAAAVYFFRLFASSLLSLKMESSGILQCLPMYLTIANAKSKCMHNRRFFFPCLLTQNWLRAIVIPLSTNTHAFYRTIVRRPRVENIIICCCIFFFIIIVIIVFNNGKILMRNLEPISKRNVHANRKQCIQWNDCIPC